MSEFLDNLGRQIELGNHTLGEIRDLISSLKVGKATKVDKKDEAIERKSNDSISKIHDLLQQYTKDFEKEKDEQKAYIDMTAKTLEAMQKLKAEKKSKKPNPKLDTKIAKAVNAITKGEANLAKAFSHKSLGVHDSLVYQSILNLTEAVKNCCKESGIKKAITPKSVVVEVEEAEAETTKKKSMHEHDMHDYDYDAHDKTKYQKIHNRVRLIEHVTSKFEKFGKAVLGFSPWDEISKEIPNEIKFTQSIREAAFEIQGITKETRGLQQEYEKIGNNEHLTGVDRTKFQESYLKGMRNGIKDQKALKNVTTAQLNTEKQLGLEAGSLQETFQMWHLSSKLTAMQIDAMGRGLRDVSKYTGLSGEAMKKVVESSKELIDTLRNAGNLNAFSNKNATRIMAEAEKRGIGPAMQPIVKAMTSRAEFFKADDKTRNLLLVAAKSLGKEGEKLQKRLLTGTALNYDETSGQFAKGLDNIFKQRNKEGKGLNQIDEFDPEQLGVISHTLEAMFGKEVGELRIFKEAFESGKTFMQSIKDIEKELKGGVSAEREKLLLEEKRQMMISKSADILSQFNSTLKNSKTTDEALSKFGNRSDLYKKDLPTLGVKATDNAGVVKETLMAGFNNLNESLTKAGKQKIDVNFAEFDKALKNNDTKTIQEILAKFTAGEKLLSTEQKTSLDPLSVMIQTLNEINGGIRNVLQGIISNLLNSILGEIIIISIAVAGIFAGILALTGRMALFAAETYNLFRGGEGVYGRYQKGLLEYIGILNKENPDPKVQEIFQQRKLAAEAKAAKSMNNAAVATQDVAATATTKNVAASQDAATTAASKASRVAQKSGPEPRVSGLKGFLERIRDKVWGSEKIKTANVMGHKTGVGVITKNGIVDHIFDFLNKPIGSIEGLKKAFLGLPEASKKLSTSLWKNITEGTESFAKSKVFTKGFWVGTKDSIESVSMGARRVKGTKGVLSPIGEGLDVAKNAIKTGLKDMKPMIARGLKETWDLKNFFGLSKTPVKSAIAAWGRLAQASSKGIKASYQGIKAATVGTTLGTATIVFAAIDGVLGAFEGFSNTAKNFDGILKSSNSDLKELNTSMYVSSTIGGAIWGILNGILLRLPELLLSMAGLGGQAEKFFVFLTHSFTTFFMGIWDGIKEGFAFFAPYFESTWNQIKDQFANIGKSFVKIWNSIGEAFGLDKAASMEEMFINIWKIVKPIGEWVGRIVGYPLAGFFLGLFKVLSFGISIIEGVVGAISGIIEALSGVIKFIKGWVKLLATPFVMIGLAIEGFVNLITGIFTGDFGAFKKSISEFLPTIWGYVKGSLGDMIVGLGTIIAGVWDTVYDFFAPPIKWILGLFSGAFTALGLDTSIDYVKSTVDGIKKYFWDLYMWLVGGSLVPDLVNGIIHWFGKLPEKIYGLLSIIPSLIGKAFLGIGSYFESFGNSFGFLGSAIAQIGNVISFVGNTFKNVATLVSGFGELLTGLFTFDTTKIGSGLGKIGTAIISQVGDTFSFLYKFVKNGLNGWGKVLQTFFISVPKMIWSGLKGLMNLGAWMNGVVMNGLVNLGTGILKFFYSLPGMIWNSLKVLAKSFVDLIVSIPGMMLAGLKAIGETIYEASPEWLKKVFDGVLYIGNLFDKNIIQPMREFGGWVAGKFDDWFMNPLKTFGSWISGKLDEWFKKPLDNFVSYASKQWEDFTNFVGSIYGKLKGIVDTYIMQPFNNGILAIKNTFMSVINTIQDALEDMVNFFLRLVAWVPGSSMVAPKAKTPEQIQKERSIRDKKLKTSIYDGVLEKNHVLPKDLQLNNPVSPKINNIETMPSRAALITAPRETNTMPSRAALITRPNKTDKTTAESIKTLTEEATEKHSIYTHDTHVEKILNKLISNNSRTMTVESNIPLEKSIESEKTFNSIMDVSKNIFDIMSNPKELVNHITDIPKQIFGAITDAPKNIFNSITNPKDMLNTVSEASKQIFNNVFNKNKITEVPKQEFKITSNSSLNETNGFLYTLTKYSQVNNALQQGIISLLSKTDVASTVRNTPTDIEPNPDEIGNSYYYKQNLEKQNAAQTVLNVSPMVEDVSTAIQKDKVVSEPLKTEIVSSELSDIADDSSQQTALMQKFVNLLEDVKELLKPKTNITSSSGGYPGNTSSRQAVHNPPNYNRNTVGLVSQTPAKGVLNLGQPVL